MGAAAPSWGSRRRWIADSSTALPADGYRAEPEERRGGILRAPILRVCLPSRECGYGCVCGRVCVVMLALLRDHHLSLRPHLRAPGSSTCRTASSCYRVFWEA